MDTELLIKLNFLLPILAACASCYKLRNSVVILSALLAINNILLFNYNPTNLNLVEVLDDYKIAFKTDHLSIIFSIMVTVLYFITNLYSFAFLNGQNTSKLGKDLNPKIHFFFTPIAIMATLGVAYSANLLTLFVFYELLTFSTYPLVIQSFSNHARKAGKYYIITLFGSSSFFLILALILLDNSVGNSNFQDGGILQNQSTSNIIILLVCFVFGFSKTAIFPLYKWLSKAMAAPIPVSALLHAVAVVKAGIFALMKVLALLFGIKYLSNLHFITPLTTDWLTYLASFSMVFAGFIACRHNNLKKILAYSTISQLSYIILLLSLITIDTYTAAFLQIISHSIAKITLFFATGIIYISLRKTEITDMNGIFRILPIPCLLFILASFSIVGLPPSIGWIIKSKVLDTINCDHFIGSFAKTSILISTAMSCYYLLRPIYFMLKPATEKLEIYYQSTKNLSAITTLAFLLSIVLFFYLDDIIKIISLDLR
jgi:multicomponent Na+:H+ antiporter subunit D